MAGSEAHGLCRARPYPIIPMAEVAEGGPQRKIGGLLTEEGPGLLNGQNDRCHYRFQAINPHLRIVSGGRVSPFWPDTHQPQLQDL